MDPRGGRLKGLATLPRRVHAPATLACLLCALAALVLLPSCARGPTYPPYSPHENLLSIATEFSLLAPRDPYREYPGQDLTGQSIARITLVRLANYESLHPDRLVPEILMLRARALEVLGDYRSARRNYLEAAEYDTELRAEAEQRAAVLGRLLVAMGGEPAADGGIAEAAVFLAERAAALRAIAGDLDDRYYAGLARMEAENADVERAEVFVTARFLLPDGDAQAQQALERLVTDHRDSRRSLEHAMRLADFHATLAREEVRLHPPESARFDEARFRRHHEAALDLFYRIAQADGQPEKIVARHRLDAMLAYGEQVLGRAR